MRKRARWLAIGVAAAVPLYANELFETGVRPLFASKCISCHSGKSPMAGLDLTSAASVKNKTAQIVSALRYEGKTKMPPAGKLKEAEIAAVARWVAEGAVWPAAAAAGNRNHWSFQPLRKVTPPEVRNTAWVRNEIDRFVLARLEGRGLQPAPPADETTLTRRIAFDLTGLPPSGEKTDIEQLLASPRYGERWGRHWMDVARYADSTGADEDHRYPHAWRYRDYVIDAFNRDTPYDQFIREQIAGDLLPSPGGGVNTRGIVATGFLALGPKLIAEQDKVKMFYDIVDEQIEVAGKAFLGMTIACARCHDHKFDPISTKDYYSLASIFASTKQLSKLEGTVSQLYFAPLVDAKSAAVWTAHKQQIEAKQRQIDAVVAAEQARYRRRFLPRMADYMLATRGRASASLDPWVVEQWTRYLKPTGERRPHLEEWEQAAEPELETIARKYYEQYRATEQYRQETREKHKQAAEAAKARGDKAPE
ncbi:MAG: DUF1549 domain-containing protein, partial [Bryobacterales bacterium]|nr:DUF1549 domain-containing protein [Bryobacterales bacterium]